MKKILVIALAIILISGEINMANTTIKLEKIAADKTKVTVTSRGLIAPKPNIASGVIAEIAQKFLIERERV